MRIELEKRANPSTLYSILSPFLALVLTVVYAMFYRLVIRASEVAGGVGKVMLTGAACCLAGGTKPAMLPEHKAFFDALPAPAAAKAG